MIALRFGKCDHRIGAFPRAVGLGLRVPERLGDVLFVWKIQGEEMGQAGAQIFLRGLAMVSDPSTQVVRGCGIPLNPAFTLGCSRRK